MIGDQTSATGDADLAIHRFHRWALDFAKPGRRRALSAMRFGLVMVAAALAATIPVVAARMSFNFLPPPAPERGLLEVVFGLAHIPMRGIPVGATILFS